MIKWLAEKIVSEMTYNVLIEMFNLLYDLISICLSVLLKMPQLLYMAA